MLEFIVLTDLLTVAHAEPEAPEESQWHLFNDFSVKPVSAAEALTFNTRWKMPSMLVYQLKTANNKLDTDWVKNIDTSVLHIDFKYANFHSSTFTLISFINPRPQTRRKGTSLPPPRPRHRATRSAQHRGARYRVRARQAIGGGNEVGRH